MTLKLVVIALLTYILGMISSGELVAKYLFNTDLRGLNSSYTRIHELFKTKGLLYVLLADFFKAVIVILIGGMLLKGDGFTNTGKLAAMFFALLGQAMPINNGLRSRKSVIWAGLLLLIVNWRILIICAVAFLIVVALTKYISLGALISAIAFPVFTGIFIGRWLNVLLAVCCSLVVVAMYGRNLLRLLLFRREAPSSDQAENEAEAVQGRRSRGHDNNRE
ncbi:MAG: glycerol-3-phosphate acyltransferase [Papillibacter sp.]|nr:glycerol-3-phosphate acyltransferase [Papillibacter sp.]